MLVVIVRAGDGPFEDRRLRGRPRHRGAGYVPRQPPAGACFLKRAAVFGFPDIFPLLLGARLDRALRSPGRRRRSSTGRAAALQSGAPSLKSKSAQNGPIPNCLNSCTAVCAAPIRPSRVLARHSHDRESHPADSIGRSPRSQSCGAGREVILESASSLATNSRDTSGRCSPPPRTARSHSGRRCRPGSARPSQGPDRSAVRGPHDPECG